MTRTATQLIVHPIVLGAVAVLVFNDHFLKAYYPSWITGKLSDAAGLVFFPVLFGWVIERAVKSKWALSASVALVMVVFAWVKCDPFGTTAYRYALGTIRRAIGLFVHGGAATLASMRPVRAVTDPTDLLALPFGVVSLLLARVPSSSHSRSDRGRRGSRSSAGIDAARPLDP